MTFLSDYWKETWTLGGAQAGLVQIFCTDSIISRSIICALYLIDHIKSKSKHDTSFLFSADKSINEVL